ncbi:MAG TPA: amidohydrolase family protein [Galbitalea sp.]|jgi:L-fuconolactonase|nr:amidohydrolase family protein [Galbitalea sp.]
MPALPEGAVDAHVHLWQRARTPQDWIDPVSMRAIDRDFWFDDLDTVLVDNGMSGCVVVQSANSGGETDDLLNAELPSSVAIVGWIDLESESVRDGLDELLGTPNGSQLAGLRHLAHTDPDPHWMSGSAVSKGFDALERAGLSFDFVVTQLQLADCAWVAGEHPELVFVLDHLGKPDLRHGDRFLWEQSLRALASHPNVYAKLSGLTVQADWGAWRPDDLRSSVAAVLDCFGPERLMFGSDWPLVELCGGYSAWNSAAHELLSELNAIEQDDVFGLTARRAYRIAVEPRA